MFPLSFREFFSIYNGTKEDAFNEYLIYGGLPLTVLTKTANNKIKYLERERTRIYLKDVIDRNNIQNAHKLDYLVEIVSSSVGSLTNPLKLSKSFLNRDFKSTMTDKTIFKYLSYLEDAFLIEKSKRYDIKRKNILKLHIRFILLI